MVSDAVLSFFFGNALVGQDFFAVSVAGCPVSDRPSGSAKVRSRKIIFHIGDAGDQLVFQPSVRLAVQADGFRAVENVLRNFFYGCVIVDDNVVFDRNFFRDFDRFGQSAVICRHCFFRHFDNVCVNDGGVRGDNCRCG